MPVFGSFGSKKKAREFAKMMDGLPDNLSILNRELVKLRQNNGDKKGE